MQEILLLGLQGHTITLSQSQVTLNTIHRITMIYKKQNIINKMIIIKPDRHV